jgi:hypothetical protein
VADAGDHRRAAVAAEPQLGRPDARGEAAVAQEAVVGPPGLDVEAAVDADQLDQLRGDRLLAAGLGVEDQDDAGLAGALGDLGGQVGGEVAELRVPEKFMALRD